MLEKVSTKHIDIPDDPAVYIYVDEDGSHFYEEPDNVCAYSKYNGRTYTYFVKTAQNRLYNSVALSRRERRMFNWKMTRTNATAFELYVKFLNSKSHTHLHHAERLV